MATNRNGIETVLLHKQIKTIKLLKFVSQKIKQIHNEIREIQNIKQNKKHWQTTVDSLK